MEIIKNSKLKMQHSLNLKDLSTGLYFIELQSGSNKNVFEVVKN